ncbi:hypothetical protein, partial [Escherichia coli]|uniref:hypothetical protein n=1 Tax=Escherichia coli TaxID=562 RepID=UPI001BB06A12
FFFPSLSFSSGLLFIFFSSVLFRDDPSAVRGCFGGWFLCGEGQVCKNPLLSYRARVPMSFGDSCAWGTAAA